MMQQRTPGPKAANAPRPPGMAVQRKCGCGNSGGGSGTCGPCADEEKKKKVQRRAIGDPAMAPEIPSSVHRTLQSPGRPLDHDTRSSMESRFGHDFSRVRVHTDTHAAASAHEIDAAAYTSGTHIVFGDHRFEPHTARGRHLLAHELTHVVQQQHDAIPSGIGAHDDVHERAADRVADTVVAHGPAFAPKPIARANDRWIRREREESEPAPAAAPAETWIVDDSATPAPGQMRRSEFVDELDTAICATSAEEMRRLGQSTTGCPLLERWRPRIRGMSSRQLEVSMRRWTAGDEPVRNAREYIPRVTTRLAQSIRIWGATGRIAGVPPDLMDFLTGGTIRVSLGGMLRGAIGSLFRKARGGAAAPLDVAPVAVQGGRPLDTGVASRMSRALGFDVSAVRIHTDPTAAEAAARLHARAFTLGNDIAFAEGEYRPGTMIGDALLAHELAHVAQQEGAEGPLRKSQDAEGSLEHDADHAAVHAVVSLWPGLRRYARDLRRDAMPRLRSGLALQRCSRIPTLEINQRDFGGFSQTADTPAGCPPSGRVGRSVGINAEEPVPCCTTSMIGEIRALFPEALARVRNAIHMLRDKVGDVDEELQAHFNIRSTSDEVASVIQNFEDILNQMNGVDSSGTALAATQRVLFACRSRTTDSYCRTDYARTGACEHSAVRPTINLCGDYEESVAGQGNFLYTRNETSPRTGAHRGWVRTLIHEFAHTMCYQMAMGGQGGPRMLRSNSAPPPPGGANLPVETYNRPGEPYPPPGEALRNPDSYAWFAMEVSKRS